MIKHNDKAHSIISPRVANAKISVLRTWLELYERQRKRKKREHLSDATKPSISEDPPLNQTCRHCQQQIIGQPILLISLPR